MSKKVYIYTYGSGSSSMKTKLFNNKIKDLQIKVINKINFVFDKNSIYLFIKYVNDHEIRLAQKLKKLNNKVIYEPLDFEFNNFSKIKDYLNFMMKIFNHFDLILLNSVSLSKLYKNINKNKIKINYHEYDKSYKINFDKRSNNVYYIGDNSKTSFNSKIFEKYKILHIKSSKNKNLLNNYYIPSIHIDYVNRDHIYYFFHTSTKLATALNFKSIFICNKIPIYVELLGENYDFFFEDDLSNLEIIINKAKETIDNIDKYNNYLNTVSEVKKKLGPKKVLRNYERCIKSLIS